MRVLVLGVSGMLGSAIFRELTRVYKKNIFGTVRLKKGFPYQTYDNIFDNIKADSIDEIEKVIKKVKPQTIINCIGLINKYAESNNPLDIIPINALFPHQLAGLCKKYNARLIQPSTDCIFSGKKGQYTEKDPSDAKDLYGKTKYLGEIHDMEHAITLRTSLIGHEIHTKNELLEWFLSQEGEIKGYTSAIFSGLTTLQFSRVIIDYVFQQNKLYGLYHVASSPISKFTLLNLISEIYKKEIKIVPDSNLKMDRSLNCDKFCNDFGYKPLKWENQISELYENYKRIKISTG